MVGYDLDRQDAALGVYDTPERVGFWMEISTNGSTTRARTVSKDELFKEDRHPGEARDRRTDNARR